MISSAEFTVGTQGQGTYEITREVEQIVARSGVTAGLVSIFVPHTSCSRPARSGIDSLVRVSAIRMCAGMSSAPSSVCSK
jgi:thiamine phosphate synthase YjbQ (UPF0047 family)